jgi:hypothetical protein
MFLNVDHPGHLESILHRWCHIVTDFRIKVTEDLKTEWLTIMDILLSERETILQSIDVQRIATLRDIESAGNRIVDKMMKQGEPLVDYIFVRIL